MSIQYPLVDCWCDDEETSPSYLLNKFKKPQAWFRRAYSYPDPTFQQDHRIQDTIRAAVVFHRDGQWRRLLNIPWCLVVFPLNQSHVVVIGSMEDPAAWINQARDLGAWCWWITDQKQVFEWRAQVHDTHVPDPRSTSANPRATKISAAMADEIASDLQSGLLSDGAIAQRHKVSRYSVHKIKKRLGLVVTVAASRAQARPDVPIYTITLNQN